MKRRIAILVCLLAIVVALVGVLLASISTPACPVGITADGAGTPDASDFVVQAEVLEALQGGPLVIKVTLLYQGDQERKVDLYGRDDSGIDFDVPAGWEYTSHVGFYSGPTKYVRTIGHGERWTQTIFLHHRYANIAGGAATLKVRWTLSAADGKPLIAPAAATLKIDIPPATEERVRALCQRLEDKLAKNTGTGEARRQVSREVVDYVSYTKAAGLAPVAWRLIESPSGYDSISDFLPMVYAAVDQKGAVNRRLVKLAGDPDYREQEAIFYFWRRKGVEIAGEDMAPLLQSKNLWTKAMTYATFADRCGKEWTDQFLHDFREAHDQVPAKVFGRLVAGLDDNDFDARQKATRELRQYGEHAKVQYVEALQHPLPPEAKRRVELLLGEIPEDEDPPPVVRAALWLLSNAEDPPGRGLLRLLAEGRTDSWATKRAKAILAREEEAKKR